MALAATRKFIKTLDKNPLIRLIKPKFHKLWPLTSAKLPYSVCSQDLFNKNSGFLVSRPTVHTWPLNTNRRCKTLVICFHADWWDLFHHVSPTNHASKLITFATPVQAGSTFYKHEEWTYQALQRHLQKQQQSPRPIRPQRIITCVSHWGLQLVQRQRQVSTAGVNLRRIQ